MILLEVMAGLCAATVVSMTLACCVVTFDYIRDTAGIQDDEEEGLAIGL